MLIILVNILKFKNLNTHIIHTYYIIYMYYNVQLMQRLRRFGICRAVLLTYLERKFAATTTRYIMYLTNLCGVQTPVLYYTYLPV